MDKSTPSSVIPLSRFKQYLIQVVAHTQHKYHYPVSKQAWAAKTSAFSRSLVLWFKSCLSNRNQCVETNYGDNTQQTLGRYISDFKQIKQSVPQGSVLGPILFLLYTNDLPINMHNADTVLFADDINIQLKASNEDTLVQNISYGTATGLVINAEKTIQMSFHV